MSMYFLMKRSAGAAESLLKSFSSVLFRQPESHDLSSQLCSILSRRDFQECPSLEKLLPYIYPTHVCSLYLSLKKSNSLDPKTALGFHNWIAQRPDYKHNVQCHASLLVNILIPNINKGGLLQVAEKIRFLMIKECDSVEDVRFVLDVLRRINRVSEFKLDVIGYNRLLMALNKFKLIDELKCVFMEMLGDLVAPNRLTFNLMVMSHCRMGNVVEAESYVSEMVKRGLTPNTFTYTSLMSGHVENKDVDSALKVFDLISQKGFEPSAFTYSMVIDCLCKEDKFDEAKKILNGMLENHMVPSSYAYHVMIYHYCKNGMVDEALEILYLMESNNCFPIAWLIDMLICECCWKANLQMARVLVNKMLHHRLSPSIYAINSLRNAGLKPAELLKIIQTMLEVQSNSTMR